MAPQRENHRRRFLESCCGFALLPLLPACAERDYDAVATLSGALRIRPGELGRSARASLPRPQDFDRVNEGFRQYFAAVGRSQAVGRYAQRVKDDFEQDRVVSVSGWLISETERDLFALAYPFDK